MCKQLKGQKGFTLIELMIVVAIIGILAAIAIPNFLTYQLKSRQAEAKTNLQAIKTSEVAFQAERGCYVGLALFGATVLPPAKTTPFTWGIGPVPSATGTAWCTAVYTGNFSDVGFKATGNVMFSYGADSQVGPVVGFTSLTSCPLALKGTKAAGAAGDNNFIAVASSNLDGDATASFWDSSVDHGASDCTTGVY